MTLTKQGIRAFVKPNPQDTEVDIAHRGVQEMAAIGAGAISDFKEIPPTPKDIHKHGKDVRVFTAIAYKKGEAV